MGEGDKECLLFEVDKSDGFFEAWIKRRDKFLVTVVTSKHFKLRKRTNMRDNITGFFHKIIITSICCMLLVGCGYKTDPYWVEKAPQQEVPTEN